MNKRYEFTGETKIVDGVEVHQIRAVRGFNFLNKKRVKKGDLGCWIESESNLSHDDKSWGTESTVIYGDSTIYGSFIDDSIIVDSTVSDSSIRRCVLHNAHVESCTLNNIRNKGANLLNIEFQSSKLLDIRDDSQFFEYTIGDGDYKEEFAFAIDWDGTIYANYHGLRSELSRTPMEITKFKNELFRVYRHDAIHMNTLHQMFLVVEYNLQLVQASGLFIFNEFECIKSYDLEGYPDDTIIFDKGQKYKAAIAYPSSIELVGRYNMHICLPYSELKEYFIPVC